MVKGSAEDSYPLVQEGQGHKTRKPRHGIFLPVVVLISTLVTLCCIVFQLNMFILYLDLKQQSRQNSLIIAQYMTSNESHASKATAKNTDDDIRGKVISGPTGQQYQTETLAATKSASTDTTLSDSNSTEFPFKYGLNDIRNMPDLNVTYFHHRNRRSDEPDLVPRRNARRNNNRNDNSGRAVGGTRERQDTSRSVKVMHLELHKRHGNQLRVNRGDFISHWRASEDYDDQTFAEYSGQNVNIYERGVYLIYSQITFEDSYGRWSYSININNQAFIKCLSTEWGIEKDPDGVPVTTYGQCHTAAVTQLKNGDTVHIKSMYRTDNIHTDMDLTFWGFVKLS